MKIILTAFLLILTGACSLESSVPRAAAPHSDFAWRHCRAEVYNRGAAPDSFLWDLTEWAAQAPDSVFEPNPYSDIYGLTRTRLGPWMSIKHRRAAMLESLRVLAAYESSFNWREGRDQDNSNFGCREESGIFQTSADSLSWGIELRTLFANSCTAFYPNDRCRRFTKCTKERHRFAIEYTARLLRRTVNHHGPLQRPEDVRAHLSRDCMTEFEAKL